MNLHHCIAENFGGPHYMAWLSNQETSSAQLPDSNWKRVM